MYLQYLVWPIYKDFGADQCVKYSFEVKILFPPTSTLGLENGWKYPLMILHSIYLLSVSEM